MKSTLQSLALVIAFVIVIVVLVPQFQCIPNRHRSNPTDGKLFLIGGNKQDSTSSIYEALKESTGKMNPKIAVVVSAASSLAIGLEAYYEPDETFKSYEQLFTEYGFQPSVILLAIDNYAEANSFLTALGQENIAKILDADIVYFDGGDQSRHARSWLNDNGTDTDILAVLRNQFLNGTVIAGTSAGTAVQCDPLFGSGTSYGYYYHKADLKECQIGEELVDDRNGTDSFRYDENGAYMKGFGFMRNTLLDSHFDARGRFGRLAVAMQQANIPLGIGVDEDTAVYIYDGVATVFGNSGVWIMDSSEATFIDEHYFWTERMIFSYLTEGDSFNFDTMKMISHKEPLTSNNESVYQSDDIFGANEAVKSIISLVNADSVASEGLSNNMKPTGRVTFREVSDTKAYFSEGRYSIAHLVLDIDTFQD